MCTIYNIIMSSYSYSSTKKRRCGGDEQPERKIDFSSKMGFDIIKSLFSKSKEDSTNIYGIRHVYYLNESMESDNLNRIIQNFRQCQDNYENICTDNNDVIEKPKPKPIHLYINSPGGDLSATFALIDVISDELTIPVHTHVEGSAKSAAALLSMAGKYRTITRNSTVLIHQLSTHFGGPFGYIEDEYTNCAMFMELLKRHITKCTNGKFPASKMKELLKHDLELTAEECLCYGMVDEIIGVDPNNVTEKSSNRKSNRKRKSIVI
jgi:ATP-dependent protease ClpP protease subunit